MGVRRQQHGKGFTITLWETVAEAIARDIRGEAQPPGALLSNFFTELPHIEVYDVKLQI